MSKKMIFNERIAEAIKNNGYTQKQFMELLGMSDTNFTHWKNKDYYPTLEEFFKICVLLDESADYLLGLDE